MRKWVVWPLAIMAAMLMLAITAAMPSQEQDKRPLQPLLQDYYSGGVTILDVAVPAGIQLVACVDSCATYQTDAVTIVEAGAYTGLVIEPSDRRMIGRDVTFHIVNEHGSIQASQTREFYGVYDLYSLDLTFNEPLPRAPTPTPEPTATPEPTPAPTPTPVPPTATPEPTPHPRADADGHPACDRRHRRNAHTAAGHRGRHRAGAGRRRAALRRGPPRPWRPPVGGTGRLTAANPLSPRERVRVRA